MKESILYLSFLKKNLTLIIIPTTFFLILGFVYQVNKPTHYQISRLYEFEYKENNITQAISLADQAVTLVRSEQVRKDLQIENLSIYKPGPLSMVVVVTGQEEKSFKNDLQKVNDFLIKKYDLKIIGKDAIKTQMPSLVFIPALISAIGFLTGLSLSLIKSYLKNY